MNKTNVIHLLEANEIPYDVKHFNLDDDDLSGISVTKKIGISEDRVIKALIAEGERIVVIVF